MHRRPHPSPSVSVADARRVLPGRPRFTIDVRDRGRGSGHDSAFVSAVWPCGCAGSGESFARLRFTVCAAHHSISRGVLPRHPDPLGDFLRGNATPANILARGT